ncbi:MAG: RidA family protein [Burkholderiaceae bacterium]|nr:RidA family protein [Burkholderiaceae bacterium]
MQGQRIRSGSSFESLVGYSRAVVEGRHVHVSGTTGFDYASMRIDPDPEAQARQCFRNIAAALHQAGAGLDDVIRVRYLLADAALFERLAPVFAEHLGRAAPAATAMVVGLVDSRMHIEIEVTAVIPDKSGQYA